MTHFSYIITIPSVFNDLSLVAYGISAIFSPSVGFQAAAVTVDRKCSCRLYPSLPKVDRHEVSMLEGAAAHRLQSRSTDTQVRTYANVEDTVHRPPGNERVCYWKHHRLERKNPKMRKKEVNGSSCIIPTFHISVLPFKHIFFLIYSG